MDNLTVGDVIDAGPLLGPVTSDTISLMVVKLNKTQGGIFAYFEVTFMGVRLGDAVAKQKKGESTWTWA